jgi:hypothetical protein
MPMSRFLTVASERPSRSISILSRTLSLRSWSLATSRPDGSSSTNVWRILSALPSTR